MNKLFVVLPCYNEAENIAELIETWKFQEDGFENGRICSMEIVAVDDGSTDMTGRVLKRKEEEYGNITVIRHMKNQGLGGAMRTGLQYAVNHADAGDYICTMDSDNTHHPAVIHKMLEKVASTKSDCVIASRYRKNSNTVGVSILRQGMSYGARLFYTLLMNIPNVRDYTCGYRLYKASLLQRAYDEYSEGMISEKGFTCMVELLYKLYMTGARFEEVPFELRYDLKKGISKMKVFRNALKSLGLVFKLKISTQANTSETGI